ncbi:hypothetical protein [uncultured Dubosiella sp.]|uniref:hypothetical protein n=1 Tax=uncultured Dubosiella sp. TaxID=1937011 RepID=UPI002730B8EB|nr:hypothetical protein [uncultured Dubosiella sp.]
MNKRLWITMAGTMLGMGTVTAGMPITAQETLTTVVVQDPTVITTADQFIDTYCSIQIQQLDPVTKAVIMDPATAKPKTTPQLITGVDETNYTIVLEGAGKLPAFSAAFQQDVKTKFGERIAQAKANPGLGVITLTTYDDLVAAANQVKAKIDEENAKKEQEAAATVNPQPTPEPTPIPEQPAEKPTPEQPVDPTPVQPAPQAPAEQPQTPAEEQLGPLEQPAPAPTPEQPAENLDLPSVEKTEPDEETLETPEDPVEQPTAFQPMTLAFVSENAEPAFGAEPKTSLLAQAAFEPEVQPQQELVLPTAAAPVLPVEAAPQVAQPAETTVAKNEAVSKTEEPTTKSSSAADEFIAKYASESGMMYRSATGANYTKIISGLSSWNKLSRSDKEAVNTKLQNAGGKSYQKLLQEAQSIQFAAPAVTPGRLVPRINTATTTHAGLYGLLCGLASAVLGYLFTKRKEF